MDLLLLLKMKVMRRVIDVADAWLMMVESGKVLTEDSELVSCHVSSS